MLPGIYRSVNGSFEPFDSEDCQRILRAAVNGEDTVAVGHSSIVLRTMEEVTPGAQRVHILMVPHFGLHNVKQLATPMGVMLWMKILMDVLSEAYIREAVEEIVDPGYYVETIKPRQSFTEDTFLVDQFANTLASLSLRDAEHILGQIFQKFAAGTVGKAELVFHGTPSKNINSIMTTGMDANYRRSSPLGDWFAKSLSMPLQKASGFSGTGTVIVFLVLATSEAVVRHYHGDYVILNSSKYQLPLATINVRR